MNYKQAKIGLVPNHWEISPLSEFLTRITYGFTNPMPDSDEGPWKLTAKDVVDGKINYHTARRTTKAAYENLLTDKSRPKVGDILLTKDGSIGRVAVVDKEGVCINQSVALLQRNQKIDAGFLGYLLQSPYYQSTMENDAHGTTIKHIYIKLVAKMEVAVPPLYEQTKIVDILKSLDDKIENNSQINAALGDIAQNIFKEWFVNFNFSGATGEMVESSIGSIPQDWRTRSLYDSASYINGAAYKNINFSQDNSGLPIVKINELKYGITSQTKFTTEELDPKYKIDTGEILFSWSGSPDTSIDIFVWSGGPAWLNQHIFRVIPHNTLETNFVYYLLRHLKPIFIEIARDKQTTGLGHVTTQDMKRMQVLYPPDSVMQAFSKITSPIYDKILNTDLETRSLVALRDALLPKLMSGEIEIEDVVVN